MENKVLIILGMHRSGTSLTAQWMHKCGINMGDELMPPTEDNKQGYWEDMDFYRLHQEILSANGLHPDGLYGNLRKLTLNDLYKNKMQSLIENKNRREKPWGWKDPKTCLFIEQYNRLVKNAFYLIVYRNPEEVIDSLLRRDLKDYVKKFNRQGVKGKIKKLFLKWYLKDTFEQLTTNYAEKYIYYNRQILNFTEGLQQKDFYAFDIRNIFNIQKSFFEKLQDNGFNFDPVDARTVFDEQLMKHASKSVNRESVKNNGELMQVYEQLKRIES